MNIRYLAKNIIIDERAKDYVEKRLRALEKILKNILQTEVEIDLDKKGKFRLEVIVKTPYKLYRSEETAESIETAIDISVGELKEQIAKDRGKIETLKMRGRQSLKKKMVLDEGARF